MYRSVPLFDKDLIFMPINITNTHWTLLAMDMVAKTISYYDSMRGNGQLYIDNAMAYLRASAEARGVPFTDSEWTCDRHAAEAYPPQPNSFDCGIYVVMVADLLTSRLPVRLLTLEAMARARTHISMCLWEGTAPDLANYAPYYFTPTPAPTIPRRTQARLVPLATAPPGPPTDAEVIASILKTIVKRVVIATSSPTRPAPALAQSPLLLLPPAPTGPSTDAAEILNVLNDIVTKIARAPPLPSPKPKRGRPPAGGKSPTSTTKRKYTRKPKSPYESPHLHLPTTPIPSALPTHDPTYVPTKPLLPPSSQTPPDSLLMTLPFDPTLDPTLTQHALKPTPDAPPKPTKRKAKYVEPVVHLLDRSSRSTRNSCGIQDSRTVKVIPSAQLTRLRHLAPDTCRLAIGPSQQYDGGQELYLDQTSCQPGTIIAYYEGEELSDEQTIASTSRYIFTFPTGPDSTINIDAIDPACCYARYADDSLYDGSENAHWVEIGTGSDTRLALVATKEILRGTPIRACYGWEYWFQPNLFPIDLMTKAFRGYINYIKDDDDAKKAWDFAAHVALEQLLLDSWNGVRRDRLPTTADKDMDPTDRPLESDLTINPTDTPPQPDPTTDPTPMGGDQEPLLILLPIPSEETTPVNAATCEDQPTSERDTARTLATTCSTSDIRAHFAAVPSLPNKKCKRPRDAQVRNLGEPSNKKQKAREAISGLLLNCPGPRGTKRKRSKTLLDGGRAPAAEKVARTNSRPTVHDLSDTAMPTLHPTETRIVVSTRAPLLGPSLNLVTVPTCGSSASTELTHRLPASHPHPDLHVCLPQPSVPDIVPCLASSPLGSTTTSHPLNER